MPFNAGTVKGELDLKIQRFKASVQAASRQFSALKRAASAAGSKVKGLGGFFKSTAFKIGGAVVGFLAVRKAITSVTGALKDGIVKQQAYEQSVRKLSASLITQGAPAVAKITKDMEAFATALQDTTAYGDVDVLGTAQALSTFGAASDKLKEYTKVVLDAAAAFNLDAKTAARAFGQALAGNAITLGRYIPAVKGLTQEQLKAGEAFKITAGIVSGFSELAAQSTLGAITQMKNAWDDVKKRLGAAFNESIRPLAEGLTKLFRGWATTLGENTEGFKRLVVIVAQGFLTMLEGIQGLISGILSTKETLASLNLESAYLQQAFINVIASIGGGFKDIDAWIARIAGGVAKFIAALPGLPQGLRDSIQEVVTYFQKSEAASRAASVGADQLRSAVAAQVKERKKELLAIIAQTGQIKANLDLEINRLKKAIAINDEKRKETEEEKRIREQKEQQLADTIRAQKLAAEHLDNLKARLTKYREMRAAEAAAREGAEGAAAATNDIANAANAANSNVNSMANSFDRAASSASAAASAAASISGDAGISAGASRREGGRTSLDFSDPFHAIALAQQAQERLRATHPSAWAGRSQVNAAAAYARDVGAAAQAAVDRALSDYTSSLISELNSAGVMDPTERSRIIRERIAEAQRLGVVPSSTSLERINAGVLR